MIQQVSQRAGYRLCVYVCMCVCVLACTSVSKNTLTPSRPCAGHMTEEKKKRKTYGQPIHHSLETFPHKFQLPLPPISSKVLEHSQPCQPGKITPKPLDTGTVHSRWDSTHWPWFRGPDTYYGVVLLSNPLSAHQKQNSIPLLVSCLLHTLLTEPYWNRPRSELATALKQD